jgi:hypothetical protein
MKNEVFDFGRFWNYFKYDLKQMWRNHSKPALFIGGMELLLYVVWVLLALVFTGHWNGPVLAARITVFVIAFTVLELYQTRTYGHLTDPQKGSAWLMVPASTLEKYISMMLITLIVIPVLFLVVFYAVDSILALLDPTVGDSILGIGVNGLQGLMDEMAGISGSSLVHLSFGNIIWIWIVGLIANFLYFLLCGICFKRYKILGGIGILFLLSIVMSIIAAATIPAWSENLVYLEDSQAADFMARTFRWISVWTVVLAVGEAVGIYYRIKTLKH